MKSLTLERQRQTDPYLAALSSREVGGIPTLQPAFFKHDPLLRAGWLARLMRKLGLEVRNA